MDRQRMNFKLLSVFFFTVVLVALPQIAYGTEKRGYSYLDNPEYDAYESMFELNQRDCDIVFVGDSITARCRYEEFFPDSDILNRGIGSDVTEGIYNRIDEIIGHHPKLIFIMVGINDIAFEIPVSESIDYYRKTIAEIHQQLPFCKVFVESLLPTTTIVLGTVEDYNRRLSLLSDEMGVEYIDLYSLFIKSDGIVDMDLFSNDGIHLNGSGYRLLISEIQNHIDLE